MTGPTIAYVAMTHLGLVSAAAAAERGFHVIAFDPDPGLIADLTAGRLLVSEPDLDRIVADRSELMQFTADPSDLSRADVVYVAPDVATDDTGASDLSRIDGLIDLAAPHVRTDAVLVVLSQVPPGYTRRRLRAAGPTHYQVETLIFGRAVERALHPERTIVGCPDPSAPLPEAYAAFLAAFDCPVLPMRLESAELCKIAINCFLVASVSTTNTLADLCGRIGADWEDIAPALRLDARIGPKAYLKPGLGISGGNLERDLASVVAMAERTGADARVIEAYRTFSDHAKDWPRRALDGVLSDLPDAAVAVLGLAYKEDTHSTKNSPALKLIAGLNCRQIRVHDPVVAASAALGAVGFETPLETAQGADALVLATPWAEYRTLDWAALAAVMNGRIVIDPYRLADTAVAESAGLNVVVLGRGTQEGSAL